MLVYETQYLIKMRNGKLEFSFDSWQTWDAAYEAALEALKNRKTRAVFVNNLTNRANSICLVNED